MNTIKSKNTKTSENLAPLFRFPLSKEITESIHYFAKLHQYNDRKTFKEEWRKWIECEEIKEQIEQERTRLKEQTYDDDLIQKLFVSARYYYRTLKDADNKIQKPRKDYTSLSKDFLKTMDNWIIYYNSNTPELVSPNQQYIQYCRDNVEHLRTEITRLKNNSENQLDVKEIEFKFKKTFKNREFIIRNK